jgi:uroporphyrinogen III methyltransferase/synthase
MLTLAALRALEAADVVLYDALVSPGVLAYCPPSARMVAVGKRAGAHSMAQEEISALLVAEARAGNRVVRLKGGDPFVFGRGAEEALVCREAGIPFTVIPGVTSAVAVPAYAGIPVTHRGTARTFAIITGTTADEDQSLDWKALAGIDTVVLLMGASNLGTIAERLVGGGLSPDTPAAAISNGSLPSQGTVFGTLRTIAAEAKGLPAPLITVVGEVVRLGPELSWFEAGPLAGKSVVVTRTRSQASQLRSLLETLGADVIEAPVLDIRYECAGLPNDERLSSRWDWIVFSSQNGVDAFFSALLSRGRDARSLGTTCVAAIGSATAGSLDRRGLIADFVPTAATARHLADELPRAVGARILVPGGNLGDGELERGLRSRGAHVEQVAVYSTAALPLSPETLDAVLVADAVTFASASAATFLGQSLNGSLPETAKLCAIGPQAAAATLKAFGRVDCVAGEASVDGLARAVVEALE